MARLAKISGWAAVLSQGLASKALNIASRSGATVSPQALARDNVQNATGLISGTAGFAAASPSEPSSAGVSLYRESAKLSGLQEKSRSNMQQRAQVEQRAADPKAPVAKRDEAKAELKQFDADDQAFKAAQQGVAMRSKESQFVSGFGNNGGEEFLSYLNVGEALKEKGGADWKEWKTENGGRRSAARKMRTGAGPGSIASRGGHSARRRRCSRCWSNRRPARACRRLRRPSRSAHRNGRGSSFGAERRGRAAAKGSLGPGSTRALACSGRRPRRAAGLQPTVGRSSPTGVSRTTGFGEGAESSTRRRVRSGPFALRAK